MSRPRHPRKELEAILREAEGKGWRVTKGRGYFKLWCPCPRKCRKTVHLTPSDPRYAQNLKHALARDTCWGDGKETTA